MAKSSFACAECPARVWISAASRRAVDSLAEWHEQNSHICNDCKAKRTAAESAAAAERSAAESLPYLQGSEAQVRWAETIRRKIIDDLREGLPLIEVIGSRIEIERATEEQRKIRTDQFHAALDALPANRRDYVQMQAMSLLQATETSGRCEALLKRLTTQDRASWWIDNRTVSPKQLSEIFLPDIIRDEAMQPADQEEASAERQIEAAAMAEALLLPPGELASPIAAEISFPTNHIIVAFPERNETLRLVMRREEFEWSRAQNAWVKWTNPATAIDRMAEIAHYLLAAGFMVRLHDSTAREMAIAGTFAPEQRRWIRRGKGGNYSGWFQIAWPKRDDFYDAARSIRGSKYAHRSVWVPPACYGQVVDFAERYGFSISEAAQGVIDLYRAARAAGIRIEKPVSGAGETGDTTAPALKVFDFEIDDEFLDDE